MTRVASLLVLLFALPAVAEWVDVPVAPGADPAAYDRDKLLVSGNEITYWRRTQFRMPLPAGEALAATARYRESIDCARRTLRTLGYLLYGDDGTVLENVYMPQARAIPIAEGSVAAAFETALCAIVAAKREAEAAETADPYEAQLRRLEEELQALEESIRRLREGTDTRMAEPAPPPENAIEAQEVETRTHVDTAGAAEPRAGPLPDDSPGDTERQELTTDGLTGNPGDAEPQ
jgi:hypothetical protein